MRRQIRVAKICVSAAGWGAQGVSGLVLACWWFLGLCPGIPRDIAVSLVVGAGCRAPGVLGLMPADLCAGPCPGPCGGQGHVLGWLWAQAVLRHPACWWVGLCFCLASCLAWGILVLMSTGCWWWWWGGGGGEGAGSWCQLARERIPKCGLPTPVSMW